MRLIALCIALVGLFCIYLLFLREPLPFRGYEEIHTEVSISGNVDAERIISRDFRLLTINNFSVVCSCSKSYLHRKVLIFGRVEEYGNSLQVRALRIRVLDDTPS